MKKNILFTIISLLVIGGIISFYFVMKDKNEKRIYQEKQEEIQRKNEALLQNDYFTQRRNKLEEAKKLDLEAEELSKQDSDNPYQKYFYSDNKEILPIENISSDDDFLEVLKANMLMFFKYFNVAVTKEEINDYIKIIELSEKDGKLFGPSPYDGCIALDGKVIGCIKPYIENVMNQILKEKDTSEYKRIMDGRDNGSGQNLNYSVLDIPVIVIVGKDYQEPTENYEWYSSDEKEKYALPKNMHSVFLIGYDKENFYLNDPLKENITSVSRKTLETSYDLYGRQKILLYRARDGLFP